MSDLEVFRKEVSEWLEENCPPSMRTPLVPEEEVWGGRNAQYVNPESKLWLERMGEKGWTAPNLPTEYGGGGLDRDQTKVLHQELYKIKARPALNSFGIWMLAPCIIEFGSEEQKREHLPKIIKGEIRWCQGYSEPGSGSDLASLSTKAEDMGDHYLVNGQKVWTSYADKADWIFALVRTGPQEPKHSGISFLLIDMASEGVSTKPITLISGKSPFCETFFDDVKAPKENLVGVENSGWTIAKKLLQHERNFISNFGLAGGGTGSGADVVSIAKKYLGEDNGKIAHPSHRDNITLHKMKEHAFGLTLQRSGDEGGKASAASSMFKYYGTEHNKDRYELMISSMGNKGLGWSEQGFSDDEQAITKAWLRTKANSIEGGTSEVQLNVISRRVLDLPS
ncbi:acyl-CoA dehydrogenase family protein [Gammaproteobacteria bacterium]|nr:acyl-CoA dehydrogenase family protein [Gammaproteobacteria bacterium]MDA9762951.1 acyl-CoA dehydrogenase family protein [Gammaproteobacteria bacterium]MDA9868390.1 acyl-CoA dehydrogenase family protein [Gammaproteobacteria bacterium]MDC3397969.1 acyl-CoA dehydrogenase family protein [Gammaproteobacteria bacterium]MDO7600298.1 acyl-CoA dehydrogenase family protein [SAR86 cluster bacterium]